MLTTLLSIIANCGAENSVGRVMKRLGQGSGLVKTKLPCLRLSRRHINQCVIAVELRTNEACQDSVLALISYRLLLRFAILTVGWVIAGYLLKSKFALS
jgi:hypothetical protein